MQECFPPEHGGELLRDPFEDLLNGGGVPDEGGCHGETHGGNIAYGGLDVVRNPLHKVAEI